MEDFTRKFNAAQDKSVQIHHVLTTVYEALKEKGYDPINQIVGYILSEDPTYITNHNSARTLICKVDRDELLQALVKNYLDIDRCPSASKKRTPGGYPPGVPFPLSRRRTLTSSATSVIVSITHYIVCLSFLPISADYEDHYYAEHSTSDQGLW